MTKELVDLKVTDIKTADNVRTDLGNIVELANSIQGVGLIQPITVDQDNVVITGHRRHAAMMHLVGGGYWDKNATVQVYRNGVEDEGGRVAVQIVENIQRKDLDVFEEAAAYQRLRDLDLTQKAIASAVGKSGAHVSRRLLLMQLPAEWHGVSDDTEDLENVAKGFKHNPGIAQALLEEHGSFYSWDDFGIRVKRQEAELDAAITATEAGVTLVDSTDYNKFEVDRITSPGATDWAAIGEDAQVRIGSDHEGNQVINVMRPKDTTKPTKGEQKVKDDEVKLKAEIKEVREDRRTFIDSKISRVPAAGTAATYFALDYLNQASVVEFQRAGRVFKAAEPNEITSWESLQIYCPNPIKAAFTMMVNDNERRFNNPHSFDYYGNEHHHQEWLADQGYKPTKVEKSWVK